MSSPSRAASRTALHFDASSGASGDMILGALVGAGVDAVELQLRLAALPLSGWSLAVRRERRGGIEATRIVVDVAPGTQPERGWPEFRAIVGEAALPVGAKRRALAMFERLCRVEGEIHGLPMEQVHLHEVGGVDSIVDIVGAAIAFEMLGDPEVSCSAIAVGSGTVDTRHGRLPVPAPATAALLAGVPTYGGDAEGELCTPTGALVLTEYATSWGAQPLLATDAIGYGAGSREIPGRANVLRVVRGRRSQGAAAELPRLWMLETNIDDMSGELYGWLMERLVAAGACEVFFEPVQMKKNRPGVLVRALAPRESVHELARTLFRETTTLGCRLYEVERLELERETVEVATAFGAIAVKRGLFLGEETSASPEYESCAAAARAHDVPLKEVFRQAREAYERARRMI